MIIFWNVKFEMLSALPSHFELNPIWVDLWIYNTYSAI